MKQPCLVLTLMLFGVSLAFAQTPTGSSPKKPMADAQTDSKPKFKAIWEPVSYKEDLNLFYVHFISKDEGWVTGAAGTILHTKDAGANWTAQLGGDPHAQGGDIKYAFILDPKHAWAQAVTTLFRTTDGESWQQVTGDVRGNVDFVSELKGFRTNGGKIFATQDGGSKWQEVFTCRAKMEVQGLTHESSCDLSVLTFPTPTVGYGMGAARITVKTEDGGASWRVVVGPEEPGDQRVFNAFFLDANTGYQVRVNVLYRTTDGGDSWQGVIAKLSDGLPAVQFADHAVGWSILGTTWAYTVDGGKHWTTRTLQLPTGVTAFSLPAPDRGYVVGEHGMIYRYRVVPIEYTSKGMFQAPMMPGGSTTPSSPQ
jgi:photosystem II stability/assembly factor-like uncharacterized protein